MNEWWWLPQKLYSNNKQKKNLSSKKKCNNRMWKCRKKGEEKKNKSASVVMKLNSKNWLIFLCIWITVCIWQQQKTIWMENIYFFFTSGRRKNSVKKRWWNHTWSVFFLENSKLVEWLMCVSIIIISRRI